MQETIRTAFADCTTLTIAHRLHTIMDSDRILILRAGSILEFDTPKRLLRVLILTSHACFEASCDIPCASFGCMQAHIMTKPISGVVKCAFGDSYFQRLCQYHFSGKFARNMHQAAFKASRLR